MSELPSTLPYIFRTQKATKPILWRLAQLIIFVLLWIIYSIVDAQQLQSNFGGNGTITIHHTFLNNLNFIYGYDPRVLIGPISMRYIWVANCYGYHIDLIFTVVFLMLLPFCVAYLLSQVVELSKPELKIQPKRLMGLSLGNKKSYLIENFSAIVFTGFSTRNSSPHLKFKINGPFKDVVLDLPKFLNNSTFAERISQMLGLPLVKE